MEDAAKIIQSLPGVCEYRWSCKDISKRFPVVNPVTGKTTTVVQAGDSGTNGKPLKDASFDVGFLVQVFRYSGSVLDKLPSEFFDQGNICYSVIYGPHGVCVGILPFNWPPVHAGGKLAPCLAVGNTMVLKPGEQTPLTLMRIVAILQSIFPAEPVQADPGLSPEVPQTLIHHKLVKMVSLTGSTASGSKAAQTAAVSLAPAVLQLCGKDALVFADADLNLMVRDTIDGAFVDKGETCTAASRILLHQDLYPTLVSRLSAAVVKLRTGDGLDETTHIGPVDSRERQQEILKYIEPGNARARLSRLKAIYPRPLTSEMTISQTEIFGPVATVGLFETEDQVVELVNASSYGLFAGAYSANFTRTMRVARRLDVGVVLVNNLFRAFLGTLFGGVKDSEYGREHWLGALREWSRIKSVCFPSGLGPIPCRSGAIDVCKL
ncbi:Aldehyde/histidinol dehydrogenase [Aspergillus falconensis]